MGGDRQQPSAEAPPQTQAAAENQGIMEPSKLLRIGMMTQEMLAEARRAPLDDQALRRLKELHERSIGELKEILPADLQEELEDMTLPFGEQEPSEAELRIAQSQLVGWLQGLFHGIQASLFAQYMQSQSQVERFPRRTLPDAQQPQRGYL